MGRGWLALSVALALPLSASAANLRRLEKVELSGTGIATALAITTDGPANWTSFKLSEPTRIVLDFPETVATAQSYEVASDDPVTRWSIEVLGDPRSPTARLTVQLARDADYLVTSHGSTITLKLRPATARPLVALATERARAQPASAPAPSATTGWSTKKRAAIEARLDAKAKTEAADVAAAKRLEAKRKADQAARRAAQEKAREAAQLAAKKKAEAAAHAEAKRRADEAARRSAQEKARKAAQLAAKKTAEAAARAEAKRRADEAARRAAQEKARQEAKLAANEKAEAAARAEAKRRADEAAKRAARQKARQEAKLAAKKKAEAEARAEAKRRADEAAKRAAREKARKAARLAAKEQAEAEARAEAKRRADEAAKHAAREKARKAAQLAAKEQAEAEARAEAKRKADEAAKRRAARAARKAEAVSGRRAAKPRRTLARLRPLGFRRMATGDAEILIRTSAPVPFALDTQARDQCSVELEDTVIDVANNRLPLDTRYFDTAVARVAPHANRAHRRVSIEIDLSHPAICAVRAAGSSLRVEVLGSGAALRAAIPGGR